MCIIKLGYDPQYGARPLKRCIQREVETPLAKGILGGDYPPGSTITIDTGKGTDGDKEVLQFRCVASGPSTAIAEVKPRGEVAVEGAK